MAKHPEFHGVIFLKLPVAALYRRPWFKHAQHEIIGRRRFNIFRQCIRQSAVRQTLQHTLHSGGSGKLLQGASPGSGPARP